MNIGKIFKFISVFRKPKKVRKLTLKVEKLIELNKRKFEEKDKELKETLKIFEILQEIVAKD